MSGSYVENLSNEVHAADVIYEFGEFTADMGQKLLLRSGTDVYLPPKTFELLAYFLAHPNRVIEKETLMTEVWPDTAVEEGNLTVHVSSLRKVLGNGKRNGHEENQSVAIETFPKIGYRFLADVRRTAGSGPVAPDQDRRVDHAPRETLRRRLGIPILVIAFTVLVGVTAVLYLWKRVESRDAPTMIRIPGTERVTSIALAPGGEYIAHTVEDRGKISLHLFHLASESSVQLLSPDSTRFYGLTFSPDNRFLYFVKGAPEKKALYKIPILGGTVTKVRERVGYKIFFSPDGSRFAYVKESPDGQSAMMVVNSDGTGEKEIVRRTGVEFYDGWYVSWSPDGKSLSTVAGTGESTPNNQIVNIDLETRVETLVSDRKWAICDGLAWLPDGTGFIAGFRERPTGVGYVWLIPFPTGEPRKITADVEDYGGIELSADGKTIMAGRFRENTGIWIVPPGKPEKAEPVKTGRHHNFTWARWLTDGGIVFDSGASGNREVWRVATDATGEQMLTDGQQPNWMPVPTPDGRYIVFSAFRDNNGLYELWRMDLDGSNQVQLTPTGGGAWQPTIAPDGKWVIYTAGEFNGPAMKRRIWKLPLEGGEPSLFVDTPAWNCDFSPDGTLVACWIKTNEGTTPQAAVYSVNGGLPIKVFDLPTGDSLVPTTSPSAARLDWTPDGKGISFIRTVDGVSNVWTQPLDGTSPRQETQFTSESIRNFEWSKDGRLMCSRYSRSRDVVLIRNFR